jgi:hypothetical protein
MKVVASYESFTAIHDHMPGAANSLRCQGRWSSTSRTARAGSNGAAVTPAPTLLLSLDLYLTTPSGPAAQVLTPQELTWVDDDPQTEYSQVQFTVVGTSDDPPPMIDVEHPQ